MDRLKRSNIKVPLIPLREIVSFPSTIIPILVGRKRSVISLKTALSDYEGFIFLSVQKNQISEDPGSEEICNIGIVARIEKSVEQRNGSYRVIVRGLTRGRIKDFGTEKELYLVDVEPLSEQINEGEPVVELAENLITVFEQYAEYNRIKLRGIISKLDKSNLSEITDIIASVINIPVRIKQSILEELKVYERGIKVYNILKKELYAARGPASSVSGKQEKSEDAADKDIREYRNRIEKAELPDHVKRKAEEEVDRLSMMPPFSAEGSVSRNYLDWLLTIPWKNSKKETRNISKASVILDEDHFGLEKVKERILDYLAVRQLVKKPSGEILCFVGPPGVGKSSLSRSIARALNREFVRIALGGVRDEAEIRGHRRTYIGSYPGQIIKGLKKAKVKNPVFLLDEIDKLSSDYKGDPASALLEVLDPELNGEFIDHYLDLEFDLSQVFFIATANSVDPIPPALKDRMEIIEIPGYTEREKLSIVRNFLLKKQAEKCGLKAIDIDISDETIIKVINQYTREAGVRNLERQVSVLMRKIARKVVEKGKTKARSEGFAIDKKSLTDFLGIPRYSKQNLSAEDTRGTAFGLAWTPAGGDVLVVESRYIKGKGDLILTGRLGEVMKESSATAFSFAKIKLFELDFDTESLGGYNIHLHIPEGAVPKEGPSAGVTLSVALVSLITGIPVKSGYAMTGEITLRGKVLPVGGIKEKIIAAHRYGISNVIIPVDNEKEFIEDLPEDIKSEVKIHLVENMDQVLDIVLENPLKINNIKSILIKPATDSGLQ